MIGRVLVAGVGYGNLRDMSAGPALVERLRRRGWSAGVELQDMSCGAVTAMHWFQENPDVAAAVFVGAVERGRAPGTVHRRAWEPASARPEEVQRRVAEAVTGVIGLDTLLTVVGHFGALPGRVTVFEVEPRDHDWGAELSRPVEAALARLEVMVAREIEALLGAAARAPV